jgi:hypothetical protein
MRSLCSFFLLENYDRIIALVFYLGDQFMERIIYKDLLTLFDEALRKVSAFKEKEYASVLDFLTDDKKSAKFINDISFEGEYLFGVNETIETAIGRARHSVISHLLGIVLGDFCGLYDTLCETLKSPTTIALVSQNKDFINFLLWAITSQNHDYGYYSNYISRKVDISDLKLKFNLLSDDNLLDSKYLYGAFGDNYAGILKNNYVQINNYYSYSQFFHEETKSQEKNDHGILGALLLYDRISRLVFDEYQNSENKPSISIPYGLTTLIHKVACLTISQHNIFKSDTSYRDKIYKRFNLTHLLHNSDYYIGITSPILLLMSLVDSIEMTKCLSRKENDDKYLRTETVLKSMKVYVDLNNIYLDFRDLMEVVKAKNDVNLLNSFNRYLKNINDLSKWMNLNVKSKKKHNNLVLHITYNNR